MGCGGGGHVALGDEVLRVGEDGGGVAVGVVEELEGDAVLVVMHAKGGEEEVQSAGVAGARVRGGVGGGGGGGGVGRVGWVFCGGVEGGGCGLRVG